MITRRFLLQRLGLAAGAALVNSPLQRLSGMENPTPKQVVVVGGGLAGLSAAYELEQRGHYVTVLEADANHIGGRVRTQRFDNGLYGELGAMRIPKEHKLTRHYVNRFQLPLRPFVQSNPNAYYYVRGRRVPIKEESRLNAYYDLTPGERNKTPLDMWTDTVLAKLDKLSAEEKADLRRVVFQTDGMRAMDQFSLEDIFKQGGLSPEAIELLAVTFAYETSLTTAITEILREELEETWIHDFDEIVGGMDRLPRAFAERLRNPLRLGARVVRVENDRNRASVIYNTTQGQQYRIDADYVVMAIPLGPMSDIDFAPGLSGGKMRAVRQVTYDSSTKVLAVCNRRFWEQEDGIYGGGTYTDLPTGITYYPSDNAQAKSAAVSNGPGVMLASYTWGQPARRLMALSPNERHRVVLDNLTRIHPQFSDPSTVERMVSWSWDSNPYSQGAFCWFSPGQHETLYQHLIAPEGRIFFAGEHASLTHSWMQGALESGVRAVEQILTSKI